VTRQGVSTLPMLIPLDRAANAPPLNWQIYLALRAAIMEGRLSPGARLPGGKSQAEIKHLVSEGFRNGTFIAPRRPGIAYMLSSENRNFDSRTAKVATTPPHVMFYAPNFTDADIGSTGAGSDMMPYIAGGGPHGFIIMMANPSANQHHCAHP
jgi:hypothetical protein